MNSQIDGKKSMNEAVIHAGGRLARSLPTGVRIAAAAVVATALAAGMARAEPVSEVRLVTWTKAQYPIEYETAIVLADAWKELGLETKIDPVNFPNPLIERVFKTHDFDAVVINFTPQLQRLDPDFYTYNTFHTDRAVSGGWNFSGLMNPELDKLLEAQRGAYDFDKRKALVGEIQKWVYEQNPWMPMVNFNVILAPFGDVRIVPERFPVASRLHGGWKGRLYNGLFVGAFNVLPRRLVRPLGWHLMAFCKK